MNFALKLFYFIFSCRRRVLRSRTRVRQGRRGKPESRHRREVQTNREVRIRLRDKNRTEEGDNHA